MASRAENPIDRVSCFGTCVDKVGSVVQSRWFALALLITSIIVFGGGMAFGGAAWFGSAATMPHFITVIGSGVGMGLFIGFSVLLPIGTVVSVVLWVRHMSCWVNRQDERKRTPLVRAIMNGDINEVQNLLRRSRINVHLRDCDMSPLLYAVYFRRADIADLLLNAGVDVEEEGALDRSSPSQEDGMTPLKMAAANDDTNMITFLIGKGAQINGLENASSTPLYYAALHNNARALTLLIELGADPTIPSSDIYGELPLHAAARRGNVECIKLLLPLGKKDAKNGLGQTPRDLAKTPEIAKLFDQISS
jgi:uncharacterized protein